MQILQVKGKLLTRKSFIQLLKRLSFPIEVITYMCTYVHMHTHTYAHRVALAGKNLCWGPNYN